MDDLPITTIVAAWAFAAGLLFGAVANKTNFCTMGAISDMVFMGDFRRMRAWMLALAVATLGTQALDAAGLVEIDTSIYRTANLGWLGAILGGLLFGFGMTMAGGCGNKTLVRLGGGNLKSLYVALVLGVCAYMTLRGLVGLARVQMEGLANVDLKASGLATQGLDEILGLAIGAEPGRWLVAALLGGGLLVWCFKDGAFRASPRDMLGGLLIGALVVGGWAISGIIGADEFEPQPLASFTFVAPTGDALQYLMTFSGATINFGIAAVGGVIVGSFLTALATRTFHLEGFTDPGDMLRHTIGAAMMGVGGVLSLGCTIGQGITGLSTLALGSLLALLSILAGGVLGLKSMEEGSVGGALKALFARS